MKELIARLRAFVLLGLWIIGIGIFAPFFFGLFLLFRNEEILYWPTRVFVKTGLALAGVKVLVRGLENLDPDVTYMFTPNHQSFIEVPILLTHLKRNVAYLAKKDLFKYPIFGFGLKLIGIVPVDRGNTKAAIESARLVARNLRAGKSYVVYPEGTRSVDGRLLPFKKGGFLIAIDAEVPIVPITVSGSAAVMPKGKLKIYASTITITVHEPILSGLYSKQNVSQLIDLTKKKVKSALHVELENQN